MGLRPQGIRRGFHDVLAAKPQMQLDIEGMAANSWLELADTDMDTQAPAPTLSMLLSGPRTGVMEAWCSGAFDAATQRIYCWGGGDTDYAGNEVYEFRLNWQDSGRFSWSRLTDPADFVSGDEDNVTNKVDTFPGPPTNSQTSPVPPHTYHGYYWDPVSSTIVFVGGSGVYRDPNQNTQKIWTFNPATNAWTDTGDSVNGSGDDTTGHLCVIDSDGILWYWPQQAFNNLGQYVISTGTLTEHADSGELPTGCSVVLRETVSVKEGWIIHPDGEINVWDLSDPDTAHTSKTVTNEPGGAQAYRGFTHDPGNDRIYRWEGGATVYSFDASAASVTYTTHTPTGDTPPTIPTNGVYDRFFHWKDDYFFLATRTSENVFIYRRAA